MSGTVRSHPICAVAVLQNGLSKSERTKQHSLAVVIKDGRIIVEFHSQLLSSCVFCSRSKERG
jgi:hypothetical protein